MSRLLKSAAQLPRWYRDRINLKGLGVVSAWQSPLLYRKRAGTFTMEDLDVYDSELTHDLVELHDQIADNPVRMYNDPLNPYSMKRYFNFVFNALESRLIPMLEQAEKKLKGREKYINSLLEKAQAEMRKAERWAETEDYEEATKYLETAFSHLHSAIDRIRYATRETPPVRSLRPAMGVS